MNSKYEFKQESDLSMLGYRITGLATEERRNILINIAIPKLGCDKCINHLSDLIYLRKQIKNGSFIYRDAIAKWQSDIDFIRETFGIPKPNRFSLFDLIYKKPVE